MPINEFCNHAFSAMHSRRKWKGSYKWRDREGSPIEILGKRTSRIVPWFQMWQRTSEDGLNVFPGHDLRRIQFWSDAQGKEFAVRLSNEPDFRAVSNPSVKYTRLVEEADYFSDMNYDWNFLLEHWMGMKKGSIKLLDDDNDGDKPNSVSFDLADVFTPIKKRNGRPAKRSKPKPVLKCRYCMLYYDSEKKRREHESRWYAEKIRKDSSKLRTSN